MSHTESTGRTQMGSPKSGLSPLCSFVFESDSVISVSHWNLGFIM